MTEKLPKFADTDGAVELVRQLGDEFAIVENPAYVFPPYEAYPLPPKSSGLTDGMAGAVMDMDGTTTTTEPLCIHSLEMMVRRITAREHDQSWPGLNKERDYPHIIGNSTTRHVEYLIRTYRDEIDDQALRHFYIYSAAWTLGHAADPGRRREVRQTISALGMGAILDEQAFVNLQESTSLDTDEARSAVAKLADGHGRNLDVSTVPNIVRAAIDIYYQRYHYILALLDAGEGDDIAQEVLGDRNKHLIEPMPGIAVFLPLLKGWLGEDLAQCCDPLGDYLAQLGEDAALLDAARPLLPALGRYFERHPARVAIVTSSIHYEADIVIRQVFSVIREQIDTFPLPRDKRDRLMGRFADYHEYYDGFITASDSSEIRLKPHRDLYSIALHQMGLPPEQFHRVAGFEDSESGTIAIRTAGIPLCCALPFPETQGHEFGAASHIARGGIPEVILKHRIFLPDQRLEA